MTFRTIFKTNRNQVISYDQDSGLWITSHKPEECIVYFGSINLALYDRN